MSGAIGAFRKEAITAAGGFTTDTLAEDCDLSIRILKSGYTIANEHEALAFTEAPETVKMFIKQRFRWTFGVMQTLWKHREVLFNKKYKALGWAAFPNMLLFQFIIPAFAPVADFFMIIGILGRCVLIRPSPVNRLLWPYPGRGLRFIYSHIKKRVHRNADYII